MAAARRDYVSEITPAKESWDVVVRVIRLWFLPDMKSKQTYYAMEMVLMDEKGAKIQASVRKALLSRFDNKICEGNVYNFKFFGVAANTGSYRTTKHQFKLNLQSSTVVTELSAELIPCSPFSFVSFPEIVGKLDMDFLIDVVAILSGVGRERVYERNGVTTKFKVLELQSNGMKLECTLFGPYVDQLDVFLQSSNSDNVVVLAQYLKVKLYNGKIQMQNSMNCTKLMFNPDIPEADMLKLNDSIGSPTQPLSYMKDASEMTLEEEFLNLSQRKTIEELKDCHDNMVCVVLGTIKHVIGGNDWWYAACVCNKGVVADSKRFFCPKCNTHVWTIVPRFRVKIRVIDDTDSATFVLFDRDCYLLTKKSCLDLIAEMDRESEPAIVPKEIGGFVDQTFLFKIDVKTDGNSGFEQSFRVKKVCADQSLITKFKSVAKDSVQVEDDLNTEIVQNGNGNVVDVIEDSNSVVKTSADVNGQISNKTEQTELADGVVRDLSSNFDTAVGDEKSEGKLSASTQIESDSVDYTPVKRGILHVTGDDDESDARILKNIKIEKE